MRPTLDSFPQSFGGVCVCVCGSPLRPMQIFQSAVQEEDRRRDTLLYPSSPAQASASVQIRRARSMTKWNRICGATCRLKAAFEQLGRRGPPKRTVSETPPPNHPTALSSGRLRLGNKTRLHIVCWCPNLQTQSWRSLWLFVAFPSPTAASKA